jgi:pilus assembly protein CpaF
MTAPFVAVPSYLRSDSGPALSPFEQSEPPEPGGPHPLIGGPSSEPALRRRAAHRAAPTDDGDGGAHAIAQGTDERWRRHTLSTDQAPQGAHGFFDLSCLGPLAPFAALNGATDLFVNGESGLWVDSGQGLARNSDWHSDEQTVRQLAVRLIALGGRHIDEASPCVDVRLADGIRVHAVLPPVSSTGTLLSIRLPRAEGFSLAALYAAGLCGAGPGAAALLERLRAAVRDRENILVTGAAGSGKTTLLAALLAEAPATERIVAIEDVAELRIAHPHVVALESRQANLEGAGRVGLDALVREALRMRPDRLIVGECRGAEIRELLAALNTGHDGGAGTLHANSLHDVPTRLEALGALAGMTPEAVGRQTVSAINIVLHLERRDGIRLLAQTGRFALDSRDRLIVEPE